MQWIAQSISRTAQPLGDGRELLDDVLDVLQRVSAASGGTGPAGVVWL
jgi:hypothetical protein